MMETCKVCNGIGMLRSELQEISLTRLEIRQVRGIVSNYINEVGSIFNDLCRMDEENDLRTKLGIEPMRSQ